MSLLKKRLAHVVQLTDLGPGLGQVDVEAEDIGRDVMAGRFAMVEAVGRKDCILLRPYSYFCAPHAHRVGFLLKDVGPGTRSLLQARPGDPVHILGPLGTIYPPPQGPVWAVAGGVGAAPFGNVVAAHPWEVLFGARNRAEAGFAAALQRQGAQVRLATDDGSGGFCGSVVDLLRQRLAEQAPPSAIYTCGPTAMMAAVAGVARAHNVPCHASLEARMGCGIGICRGCAHPDATGAWRCICVDGPVYPAAEIFP